MNMMISHETAILPSGKLAQFLTITFEISSNIWLCRNVNINEATDHQRIAWGGTDSYQMISGSVDTQIPEGIRTDRHQEPAIRMGVFFPHDFLGIPKNTQPQLPSLARTMNFLGLSLQLLTVFCMAAFLMIAPWRFPTNLDVFWRMGKTIMRFSPS